MNYKKQGFFYCGQMNATERTIETNVRTKYILDCSILITKEPNDLFHHNFKQLYEHIYKGLKV